MKISLKNISKIKEADIDINGITVIAGENNTGKSTVGKALWSIFNSFYNIENELIKDRENIIYEKIKNYYGNSIKSTINLRIATRKILILEPKEKEDIKKILIDNLKQRGILLENIFIDNIENSNNLDSLVEDIYEILNIDNEYILKNHLKNILIQEFNGQINNIYNQDNGEIGLTISQKNISIIIDSQKVEDIKVNNQDEMLSLSTRAIYIDDPYVLDDETFFRFQRQTHKEYLKRLLSVKNDSGIVENALVNKRMENINKKLEEIFKGEMKFNFDSKKVILKGSFEEIDLTNLSTGLKTFVIIKNLLENGVIEKKGTIILDEPEIHLHPEWQLIFAEIIVLLQKEFDLHILLATHSPYFLRAIQVYASKYEIADKCKYYLAENIEMNSIIKDVSDNIELIFEKLANPLQKLEDLLYD